MNTCIHKWAYRLARSQDPAEIVAKAVVTACNDVANYAVEHVPNITPEQRIERYSGALAVGQVTALFRVVQARAGHCAVR